MTGITKDELMQMAREAGMEEMHQFRSPTLYTFKQDDLESMFNAILERAAVELDVDEAKCMDNAKTDFSEAKAAWHSWGAATRQSAKRVRALKINTGD